MPALPIIETPRAVIVLLQPENAGAMLAYQIRNKARLALWEPARDSSFHTEESSCARAEKSHDDFMNGTGVNFIALSPTSKEMVAHCNFSNIVRGPLQGCTLGYSIDQDFEGQGLMKEITAAGISYIFDVLGLHRIMASYVPTNTRSENLLKSLGFEREGLAREYLKIAGKWEDMVLTSLINRHG